MGTIKTAKGITFDALWDAVASLDSALRIAIVNSDMETVHSVFRDPTETETIIKNDDGIETVYTGFTGYRGFDLKPGGEIVVALNPKEG